MKARIAIYLDVYVDDLDDAIDCIDDILDDGEIQTLINDHERDHGAIKIVGAMVERAEAES